MLNEGMSEALQLSACASFWVRGAIPPCSYLPIFVAVRQFYALSFLFSMFLLEIQ